MAETIPSSSWNAKSIFLSVMVLLIIVIAVGISGYFYLQYQSAQALLKNPSTAVAQKDKETIDKVGRLIDLPSEQPTLAEVSDKEKLKSQAFFAKAENGDKVLIYSAAKKAILYRPSTNKIIEVGPVNIADAAPSSAPQVAGAATTGSPTPTIVQPVNVVLYNGTTKTGLTTSAEKLLKEKGATGTVIGRDNAQKKEYEKTIVIDLSGKQSEAAKQYAQFVGGTVGTLPAGEAKPSDTITDGKPTDLLIILGKDFVK